MKPASILLATSAPVTSAPVTSAPVSTWAARPSRPVITRVSAMVALGLVCGGLGGCLGYDGDVQHGYQMDAQALADVKPGQTAEQVLVTLGSPSTTSTVGGDAWYYIQQKTSRSVAFMKPGVDDQRVYAVYFDKGRKVTRIANYGMQDGHVVDFSSNTTPTIGGDNSLLKGLFLNVNPFGSQRS